MSTANTEEQATAELTKALERLFDNRFIKDEADRQRRILDAWYAGYRNGNGFLSIDLLTSTHGEEWRIRNSEPFSSLTDNELFKVGMHWLENTPGFPKYTYEENAHYIIGFFQGARKEWR